jgi:hypothetical protein
MIVMAPSVRRASVDNIGQLDDFAGPGWVTFEGGISPGCGADHSGG